MHKITRLEQKNDFVRICNPICVDGQNLGMTNSMTNHLLVVFEISIHSLLSIANSRFWFLAQSTIPSKSFNWISSRKET